jgi:hypothetical protein
MGAGGGSWQDKWMNEDDPFVQQDFLWEPALENRQKVQANTCCQNWHSPFLSTPT